MFATWGHIVYRFRWLVLAFSALSLPATIYLMSYGGQLGTEEFAPSPNTEAGRADRLIDKQLPENRPSFTFVFGSDELKATSPAFRDEMKHALKPLEDDRRVSEIRTPYEGDAPAKTMISDDKKHAIAVVEMKDDSSAELQNAYELPSEKSPSRLSQRERHGQHSPERRLRGDNRDGSQARRACLVATGAAPAPRRLRLRSPRDCR